MSNITEVITQIDELNHRTVQLQTRAARIEKNANTADESDGILLLMELEDALDTIKTLQTYLSYMFRPIKESSRLASLLIVMLRSEQRCNIRSRIAETVSIV